MINHLSNNIWLFAILFCFSLKGQVKNKYYRNANNFALSKNYKLALSHIDKAIDIEGNKAPPIFYLRKYEYLIHLKKFSLGFQILNEAIQLYQNNILLLNARAEFYFTLKKYTKAIADYETISTQVTGKELIKYKMKLASTKYFLRNFKDVALILKSVLQKEPSNIDALNLLAALHIELSNYAKAKEILYELIQNYPSHVATVVNLGFTFQKENQHEKALSYFNKALKLSPNNPVALSNRAYSKLKMLIPEEAFTDIQRSIELLPTNSYAYMVRGKIYLKLEKNKKACVDFNISEKLNFSEQYGNEVKELLSTYCH